MQLTVRITGNKEEIAKFKKLGDKLMDFSDAMKEIGTELKTYYGKQVFASEGDVLGKQWAELSPVYKKWKGRRYPGKGILTASGAMSKRFTAATDRKSATITNTSKLFDYHQQGTRHMPARPMLEINTDVEDIAQHIIQNDVDKKLANA